MTIIQRDLEKIIQKLLFKGKIITLYGAHQVGKTTLAKQILTQYQSEKGYFDCESMNVRQLLENQEPSSLKRVFGQTKLIVLDEAQRIKNIGILLKLLHDHLPEIQIIATGSSSFDLSNKINEPLTGRGLEFNLYPFSINELSQLYTPNELETQLEKLLIYGSYPEIFNASLEDTKLLLDNLVNKYLYKDILAFESIKNASILEKLLQLLAFQIGNEVSKHELAVSLQINTKTVERYLDLLEKCFIIFSLKPLSRNLRKEITKKEKIFFYDLGIRNSLISQYNPIALRTDIGALWENFCILERLKWRQYSLSYGNTYFWRTHDQKEIDYIEDYNGVLHGYEFKWQNEKYKIPKDFIETYKNSTVTLINNKNFWDFLKSNDGEV
jgi:uncharacterized protein